MYFFCHAGRISRIFENELVPHAMDGHQKAQKGEIDLLPTVNQHRADDGCWRAELPNLARPYLRRPALCLPQSEGDPLFREL
jgi:hypothetical protein